MAPALPPAVPDPLKPLRRACLATGAGALLLLVLVLFAPPFARWEHAHTSMLSLHLLLELVALGVALLIVNIGWHALDRNASDPRNVLIGGFTVVAACDLVHALTYAGMPPLLGPASTERAIFYWLAGRSAEVLTLAWLALAPGRSVSRGISLGGGLLVAAALVAFGAGGLDLFPPTFRAEQGVTGFKVGYEWALCLANLAVAGLLWRRAAGHEPAEARSRYLLATSAFVVGIGELAFTRYTSPSDFQNIFGHLFKVAAYLILYRAVVAASLRRPYEALRESREQVAEREQRLAAVLDNTMDGIVSLDAQGRIVVFNRASEGLFCLPASQALGSPLTRFVPRADARRIAALARPRGAGRQSRRWRVRGRRVDGSTFPLELSISQTGAGPAWLATAVLRDLGAQAAAEAAQRARIAAEAASEAKSRFLAHMSHEIRTPMNAVLGFTDLALRGELSAPQRQHLSRARRAGEALLGLIDQVLDLSKIEAGKLELAPAPFALDELAERVDAVVGQLARSKGLDYRLERDPALPAWLLGDLPRLAQVLINLGGNAVKFTAQGSVSLALRLLAREGQAVRLGISVQDTGIGLSEAQIARLFQPFTQAEAGTQHQHGGTGLGLAISQQLVGLMGGRITVQSTPGQGSRFSFELALEVAAPVPAAARASAPAAAPWTGLRGRRVLLVEDNLLNQQLATELLEGVAGLQVRVAGDGPAALAALAADPVDLVLLDLQLPGMSGHELARRLRADARWSRLPLIALSAHAGEREQQACQAAGIDAFLGKPFDPDALFKLLRQHLDGAAPPVATAGTGPGAGPAAASTEPVDFALGLHYCGGRAALQAQVMASFVQTYAGTGDTLAQALAGGRWPEIARLAHGLAAAAGTLGARALSALAQQLQVAAEAAHSPAGQASATALVNALALELGRVLQVLPSRHAAPAA